MIIISWRNYNPFILGLQMQSHPIDHHRLVKSAFSLVAHQRRGCFTRIFSSPPGWDAYSFTGSLKSSPVPIYTLYNTGVSCKNPAHWPVLEYTQAAQNVHIFITIQETFQRSSRIFRKYIYN